MSGLQFELSIPRYLATRALSSVSSHRFFSAISCVHYRQIPVPPLPGPEWVRVAVEICGICGSDLNALRGHESFSMEPYSSFPAVMGHEIIGRITERGSGAQDLPEGTRVAVENILPCAPRGISPECPACAAGDYALCENYANGALPPGILLGFTRGLGGGFSHYAVAHKSQLFTIPESLSLKEAVLVDPLASALQPVAQHLPDNDATTLVYGAGIIGLNAVQALRAAGYTGHLIVIARHPFQAQWAKKFGADEVILRNIYHNIAELTNGTVHKPTIGPPVLDGGVDLIFDCVGSSGTIDSSMRLVRKRGKVVVVGTASSLSKVDASPLWFKEITLTGSAMFSHTTVSGKRQRTYQHAIDMLADGRLKGAGMVTHTFALGNYRKAFSVALDKKTHQSIKVAFEIAP
jgi:threonine dehydrogenase-like Zn-dependent dehydrogenase